MSRNVVKELQPFAA